MSIDIDYASKLSYRLEGFKVTSTNPWTANFRCPVCGDSQKSKGKKRGWFLTRGNPNIHVFCHNCGFSKPFFIFLQMFDKTLYSSYQVESLSLFKEKKKAERTLFSEPKEEKPALDFSSKLKDIKKVSTLRHDHAVKKYLEKRCIPPASHYRIYVAPKFNAWVNSMIPKKLSTKYEEPRLVFPFLDEKGRMFGFCGRSFKNDGLRYISIMLDDKRDKFFGLETLDSSKKYYIFEGAIDSLFIKNSIAAAGADCKVESLPNYKNSVQVFDCDKHNLQIIKRMEKQIDRGFSICVWPESIETGQDINDLIKAGYSSAQIKEIIDANTYSGLMARAKLSRWRRVYD